MLNRQYFFWCAAVVLSLTLSLGVLSFLNQQRSEPPTKGRWVSVHVRSGDSLSSIFERHSWPQKTVYVLLKTEGVPQLLRRLRPGMQVRFLVHKKQVLSVNVPKSALTVWVIARAQGGHFTLKQALQSAHGHLKHQRFSIQHSLTVSAMKIGLPAPLIVQLVHALEYQLDLDKDLHQGDRVKLTYRVYEPISVPSELIDVKLCQKSRCYRAVNFVNSQGVGGFYRPNGVNVKPAFDRVPLAHFRVSSSFSQHRWHPILNGWHAHLGVDLAAPAGVSVHATGAGRVIFSGRKGGYGRIVILQHGPNYRTVYAHLSRIVPLSRTARRHIVRGQVIGYVGQTGMATGPHCHYEFHINGQALDPLKVKLPQARRLTGQSKVVFNTLVRSLDSWMAP